MTHEEAMDYRRSLTEDERRDIDRLLGPPVDQPVVELPVVVKDPYQHDDYEPSSRCVCGGFLFDGYCHWCEPNE